jgi:hypothetical protein
LAGGEGPGLDRSPGGTFKLDEVSGEIDGAHGRSLSGQIRPSNLASRAA